VPYFIKEKDIAGSTELIKKKKGGRHMCQLFLQPVKDHRDNGYPRGMNANQNVIMCNLAGMYGADWQNS
jgi:hypothetical protein